MEKKAKETGESAAEIRKKIKCHNCGKAGHILTDCNKEKSGKPQKEKSKNKGEKVGSIFSASEVSDAVDSEDDEGFVASQGVAFCATFESDNEDHPVDAEGEEFEVMEESDQMPELIALDISEPEPFQPSRFSAFCPLPPRKYLEGFRLGPLRSHQSTFPQLVSTPEPALYDESVTWWINHIRSHCKRLQERSQMAN